MNYQSPIDIAMGQMNTVFENEVFKAVRNVGINVDKDELLKALRYDRCQYEKGYNDRDSELIRCKDCKYKELEWEKGWIQCELTGDGHQRDWFCGDAKRKEDDA